jgi:xanthine dehydrogenase YagS FAD-binding subunit
VKAFSFRTAATPEAAVREASGTEAVAFLAGGTTLVDLLKLEVEHPATVIDINSLPLNGIDVLPGGGLRVGALVRNAELAHDVRVRRLYPVLSEALLAGASPQIRNMASLGGNLLQRTRCPYFRDIGWACNKRQPGSGCAALGGYTRSHAVLGTSTRCIATHPADMPVALVALEAVVRTLGPHGVSRSLPIDSFYVSYGEEPARETVLLPGELVTHVELPATPWFSRSGYLKVRDRASFDFALASAAVALDVADGTIRQARVALGGIATKPWRSLPAERLLVGARPGAATFEGAARAALEGAQAQPHNGFKIELAQRTLVRTLERVAGLPGPAAGGA